MTLKSSRKRIELRRKIAAENLEKRTSITDVQQIVKLDTLLGKGKGATKERARLAKNIAKK
jgi:hypothetical protein